MHCRAVCLVVSLPALVAGLPLSHPSALQCSLLYSTCLIPQGGWGIQLNVGFPQEEQLAAPQTLGNRAALEWGGERKLKHWQGEIFVKYPSAKAGAAASGLPRGRGHSSKFGLVSWWVTATKTKEKCTSGLSLTSKQRGTRTRKFTPSKWISGQDWTLPKE